MKKPTEDELKLAFAKTGLPFEEMTKFVNHYESNGWKVGRNPMRSWQHAVGNWASGYRERKQIEAQRAARMGKLVVADDGGLAKVAARAEREADRIIERIDREEAKTNQKPEPKKKFKLCGIEVEM